jgi:hypothetical protein
MEEPYATPALQEFPQLQRLAMFSPVTQCLIADYWVLENNGTRNRCKRSSWVANVLLSARHRRLWRNGHVYIRKNPHSTELCGGMWNRLSTHQTPQTRGCPPVFSTHGVRLLLRCRTDVFLLRYP